MSVVPAGCLVLGDPFLPGEPFLLVDALAEGVAFGTGGRRSAVPFSV